MTPARNPMRIVCLGEAMVEQRVATDGTPGSHYGGDMLNTAIHLARRGFDVAFASALGSDAESDALIAAWTTEGLDCSLVLGHPRRRVGRYRIAVDARGERSFTYERADSAARDMFALGAVDAAMAACERADLFAFSLISLAILPDHARQNLLELAALVRTRGGKVAFDGNYRPALWDSAATARHWHAAAIAKADIGLPTLEDETALWGETDACEVARRWRGLGCPEVVIKLGARGCLLPDGSTLAPPAVLEPVDTSGAGDAFNAGYLGARLHGAEPREAALAGHACAGWTIMRPGAIPCRET